MLPVGSNGTIGAAVGSWSTVGLCGDREVLGSGDIAWSHHDDTDATPSEAVLQLAQALRGCENIAKYVLKSLL